MRPSVQITLFCATNANATAVRTNVENRILAVPQRILDEPVTVIAWHNGIFLVNAYVFCPSAADADTLYQGVIDTWTSGGQANRILSNSLVKRIDSFEDEGLADVVVSESVKA